MQYLQKIFLTLLLVLLTLQVAAAAKPNIVFVLADDLGWSDVGFNGAKFYQTPNLDALAKDGMIFKQCYSGGPNCMPTRACLMTGLYTPRHKHYTPGGLSKGVLSKMRLKVPSRDAGKSYNTFVSLAAQLAPKFVCIPEVLKKAGYVSAKIGKWHLGDDEWQGFDVFSSNGDPNNHDGNHYGSTTVADTLTDGALDFIEANKKKSFFLYLSHWDVHTPIRAKKQIVEIYKKRLAEGDYDREWNTTYAAMIHAVDKSVGRVRNKLKKEGLYENTLFIFSSDNGGLPSVTTNAPLLGGKGSLFEGGVRMPTCMTWPAKVKPGTVCETPVTSVDFLPTFAEIADVKLGKDHLCDGVSLLPLLESKEDHQLSDRSIFWFYPLYLSGGQGNKVLPVYGSDQMYWRAVPAVCMRKGDWKLIKYFEDNSVKLFNIANDIGEKNDLAKESPEKVAELTKLVDAWLKVTNAPIPTEKNPVFRSPGRSNKKSKD